MATDHKATNGGAQESADFASIKKYPPFYTLQPNLTTRARQLELWSSIITSFCAQQRIFRLSLSSPPAELFGNASIKRSLKPADVRTVLEYMSKPENGPRVEWIPSTTRGEQSSTCYVYWKTPAEWADAIYGWVEDTGQKGAVLTVYELREGDAVQGRDWKDIDEALLRKVLAVLVKRGKAQIFGQEESAGVKFF
jgi:ESCRT-II complex subunit VPS25